jgi:hypothetical protein
MDMKDQARGLSEECWATRGGQCKPVFWVCWFANPSRLCRVSRASICMMSRQRQPGGGPQRELKPTAGQGWADGTEHDGMVEYGRLRLYRRVEAWRRGSQSSGQRTMEGDGGSRFGNHPGRAAAQ